MERPVAGVGRLYRREVSLKGHAIGIFALEVPGLVVVARLCACARDGLGVLVLRGIRNLELGVGLISGLGIVLLAIILDRVTKAALDRINAAHKY